MLPEKEMSEKRKNRVGKTCLWLAAFAALLFIMPSGALAGNADRVFNEQEAGEVLEKAHLQELDEVQFTCDASFFEELSADDFALLEVLKVKAGIESARVRYAEGKRLVEIYWITWTDAPWAECANGEEAAAAIAAFAQSGTGEGTLICPPALLEEMYGNYALYAYGAFAGLDAGAMDITYYSSSGIIRIAGMTPQALDWYAVSDDIGFLEAVSDAAERERDTFLIAFDREYFAALSEDEERMEMLVLSSRIESDTVSMSKGACTYTCRDVTYTDVPRIICATPEAVTDSIRAMGAAGETAFDLILPSALYDEVTADDFSGLTRLEIEGGMKTKNLSYYTSGHHLLSYREAEITGEIAAAGSLSEAADVCLRIAGEGGSQMVLSCTPEVFRELLGDETRQESGTEKIYDLITMCGIRDYTVSYSRTSRIITILVHDYYPGKSVAQALKADDLSSLGEQEKQVLEAADKLLKELPEGKDELETARLIHDAICGKTVYLVDDDTDDDDTAAGVLLNGEANCDGYADAFYLLGTMAGLEVVMQHGSSYPSGGEARSEQETHMWNEVRINGTWRLLDATWDDTGEDGHVSHLWFAVGKDRAERTHIWNEDIAPALADVTPLEERPENEFAVSSREEMKEALGDASRGCMKDFTIVFENEEAAEEWEEALELVRKAASSMFQYQWNERMRALSFFDVSYKAGAVAG